MELKRNHALALLLVLYLLVLFGMYRALLVLGPLSEELLRWSDDPMKQGYKIFFFAMSNPFVTYVAFLVLFTSSVMYLKTREVRWDVLGSSSAKLSLLFCTLTLVLGAIFSNLAWATSPEQRAYWNWDPRQTTTLILWFLLAGYFALRSALENEEARARLSAILGIFGLPAIILTHLSATLWVSNHPQLYDRAASAGFKLDSQTLFTFFIMLSGAIVLYAYLLWLAVKIENLERKIGS